MCGRYALYSDADRLAKYFDASINDHFGRSYNIAPTATIPVIVFVEGERSIVSMRWGFIPSWHKESQKLTVLNNAKLETIDTKPSFRASFKRHRCLIIADGFYEWDADTAPKQPYYFHTKSNEPIAMAGIWDRWMSENGAIDSCCIITQSANKVVAPVHDRMPAIIKPEYYNQWLDPDLQDVHEVRSIAENLDVYLEIQKHAVTPKMNRVAFNNVDCIVKV